MTASALARGPPGPRALDDNNHHRLKEKEP